MKKCLSAIFLLIVLVSQVSYGFDHLPTTKKNIKGIADKTATRPIFPFVAKPKPLPLKLPKSYISKLTPVAESPAYYTYDSATTAFVPFAHFLPRTSTAFDPVRFSLVANKDSIATGEEIELTITAEYLNVHPMLMFTFEDANAFALKTVLPEGFVVTGGSYYDYLQDEVTQEQPLKTYTLKGYFEYIPQKPCFMLLRSFKGARATDIWEKKGEVCMVGTNLYGNIRVNKKLREIMTVVNPYDGLNSMENLCSTCSITTSPTQDSPVSVGSVMSSSDPATFRSIFSDLHWGCLPAIGNTKWFYFEAKSDGSIKINISINKERYLDYITFGPFSNLSSAKTKADYTNAYKSCTDQLECPDNRCNYQAVGGNSKIVEFKNCKKGEVYTICVSHYVTDALYTINPLSISDICDIPNITISPQNPQIGDNLQVTGCNNGTLTWKKDGYSIQNATNVQVGNYEAKCTFTECNYSTASVNVISSTPSITLSSDKDNICSTESATLTATLINCDVSNVKWYKGTSTTPFKTASLSAPISTPDTYKATCSTANATKTISSRSVSAPSLSSTSTSAPTDLHGECESGATLKWDDFTVSEPKNVGVGIYKAQCEDGVCISSKTSIEVKAPTSISIRADDITLCNDETTKITATVTSCSTLKWKLDGAFKTEWDSQYVLNNIAQGKYQAFCGTVSSGEITIFKTYSPTLPQLTTDKTVVPPNEVASVLATGCSGGTLKWYKNGIEITSATGNPLPIPASSATGTYTATCTKECGTSGQSNAISLTNAPLTITSNKQDLEVYPNEEIVLTAYGCAYGWYVRWELPTRFSPRNRNIQNPTTVSGPGTYRAQCVNSYNDSEKTEWVSLTFAERAFNKPTLTAAATGCIYDNQKTNVAASGCGGLPIEWWDGVKSTNPSNRQLSPGTYTARCYSSGNDGTSYGPWESISICVQAIDPIEIFANKTEVNPNELFELSATNCNFGSVQWQTPAGEYLWGNPATFVGPGVYRGRCYVSDKNIGPWVSYNMPLKQPGSLTIISNKSKARSNEPVTLTAIGCNSGFVQWEYTPLGTTTPVTERGKSITVFGPNTYYAWCVTLGGMAGTRASYTVTELTGNSPSISTDKQKASPTDPVFVTMTGCNPASYWLKVTLLDGTQKTVFPSGGKTVIYGPFKYEGACVNSGGGVDTKVIGEVALSTVDNIKVVPNKNKVAATELVLLNVYGCDFGTIEWRIGNVVKPDLEGKAVISQTGPGNYYARCINDPFKSDEWVLAIVNPTTDIMPIIAGPNRICPNTPVTLTASNCPAGWSYQWYTEDKGWNNFSSSTTISFPQTVQCRCLKPDWSWFSPTQEQAVDDPFSAQFKATSNSPVALSGQLVLSVTDISDPQPTATQPTYLWIPPPSVTLPENTNLTQRTLTIANATDAHAGTYRVKVTLGNCSITTPTDVSISACDNLYIKSYVATTGQQTTQLKRKAGVTPIAYEPLELSVETLDGKRLLGASYSWVAPTGISLALNEAKPYLAGTSRVGKYKVTVSFSGSSQTCLLETDISATPCQTFTEGNCTGTTTPINTDTPNENIANLAVGDVFNAGDYEVTVTQLESGSQANGWKGQGLVNQNLLANIQIPMTVTFKKIKINECYQYYNKNPDDASIYVITKFDETWGNVVSVADIIELFFSKVENIKDILKNYSGSNEDKGKLQASLDNLIESKNQIVSSNLEEYIKTNVNNKTILVNSLCVCLLSSSTRVTTSCTTDEILSAIDESEYIYGSCTINAFNEEYIVAANRIVNKKFIPFQNLKNIWLDLEGEITNFLLTTDGNRLFPPNTPVSRIIDFKVVVQRVWNYRIAIAAFEKNNFFEDKLLLISSLKDKGCFIKSFGEEFLNKYLFFGFTVEEVYGFITSAGGSLPPLQMKPFVSNKVLKFSSVDDLIYATDFIEQGKFIEGIKKIDLMGGTVTQLEKEFVNFDLVATKGIKGDVNSLSKVIRSNSIEQIVVSNPQAPYDLYLSECSKVMKKGAMIFINGTKGNGSFNKVKTGRVEQFGFDVLSEFQPLNSRFKNLNFKRTDGGLINNSDVMTTILIKR